MIVNTPNNLDVTFIRIHISRFSSYCLRLRPENFPTFLNKHNAPDKLGGPSPHSSRIAIHANVPSLNMRCRASVHMGRRAVLRYSVPPLPGHVKVHAIYSVDRWAYQWTCNATNCGRSIGFLYQQIRPKATVYAVGLTDRHWRTD